MLCLTACISLMAQNISGKLVDEAQQPLPYANVVLQTVDFCLCNRNYYW